MTMVFTLMRRRDTEHLTGQYVSHYSAADSSRVIGLWEDRRGSAKKGAGNGNRRVGTKALDVA